MKFTWTSQIGVKESQAYGVEVKMKNEDAAADGGNDNSWYVDCSSTQSLNSETHRIDQGN